MHKYLTIIPSDSRQTPAQTASAAHSPPTADAALAAPAPAAVSSSSSSSVTSSSPSSSPSCLSSYARTTHTDSYD